MKPSPLLALLFSLTTAITASGEPTLKHVDVFASGEDGYTGYRIPAVETAPDGSLLAFAEARKYNLSDTGGKGQEIDLVLKRSTDGGATWSPMKVIQHSGEFWSSANLATVIKLKDKSVGVLWERGNYRFITFTRLNRSFLEPAP